MLDDMDSGPKIAVIVIVAALVLLLAVPLIVILAAVIASFVLGLGSEQALVLAPACGPALGRRVRPTAVGVGRRCLSTVPGTAPADPK